MPILILIIILLVAGFFVFARVKKVAVGGKWIHFFSKGKELGLSFKEMEMLRHLVVQCELSDPSLVFTSKSKLDQCIYLMVRRIKMSGEKNEQETQDFLSKLYEHRQKIEMNVPPEKIGIANSRLIIEGQPLQILVLGVGVFKSEVIKNTNQYMTIARPVNKKPISAALTWAGRKLSVYFWRDDDAGYVYDADVLDEVFSMGISSLKISHSETLLRTQKRKSVRIKMHQMAFLYLVPQDEQSHQVEARPGLKCFMEDLSDTGCAVTVAGTANSGMRVKVQFALNNSAVCMTGTIRSANFNEHTRRSMLHIEAEPMSIETRNVIMGEVFGLLPMGSMDELPLSVTGRRNPLAGNPLANPLASDSLTETPLGSL